MHVCTIFGENVTLILVHHFTTSMEETESVRLHVVGMVLNAQSYYQLFGFLPLEQGSR